VLAGQRRIEVLTELVKLATGAHDNARKLLDREAIAELDYLPFRVELDRLRGDLEAAQRELEAAWRRLAARMGFPQLPPTPLTGSLETALPGYDFEHARALVLEAHPEVRSAQVGIARAQLALRREQAQVIPNVTLSAGYSRNFNDRENQATYGVSVPIPVYNRNQGNIRAAQAELGRATQEVSRVQNDLTNRLAAAFGQYSAARQRAQRYRTSILPGTNRGYQIALATFKGGQFEYLRVVQAQRAAAEANLEYIRILADAWRAASEIAGLLLEEDWSRPAPGPGPEPPGK
jgi:cobalt-zinc-cadmium efflux system outer membrane protein